MPFHRKVVFNGYNDARCPICCNVDDDSKHFCIQCYKNKLLHGVSEHYPKNKDVMIKEINDIVYDGGCTYLN